MKQLIVILFFAISFSSFSQEEENKFVPTLKFKGFTQLLFSATDYPDEAPYGFSIHRLRIMPYGNLTKNISYLFHFGYDKQNAILFDAKINFKIVDQFQVLAGQFASPGAKSGTVADELWSTPKMNLFQRSMVTQNYNSNMNMLGYRDVGVQLHGYLFDKKFYYATMLANPVANNLFTPSVKKPAYQHEVNGIKSWSRIEFYPIKGMGIGGFVGLNTYKDSVDNFDNSYGAHFIYRSDGLRVFTEFISGEKTSDTEWGEDFKYNGYFLEIGYVFNKKLMPIIGVDMYYPKVNSYDSFNVERYTNLTLGLNYYIGKRIKIMANYVARFEKMNNDIDPLTNDLFMLGLQFFYNQPDK